MERMLLETGEWFFVAWKGETNWIGLAKRSAVRERPPTP